MPPRLRGALAAALVLTTCLLAWEVWHLADTFRVVRWVEETYDQQAELSDLVVSLESRLDLSTRMAVATAAPEWIERYRQADALLADVLAAASETAIPELRGEIEDVARAHEAVEELDVAALELLEAGDLTAASSILEGDLYRRRRIDFLTAASVLNVQTHARLQDSVAQERGREALAVGVAVMVFLAAVAGWVWALRSLRWSMGEVEREARRRREAEASLVEAQRMESLGAMAAGLAHDFGNLNAVVWGSAAEIDSRLPEADPSRPAVSRVLDAAEESAALVKALAAFGRTEVAGDVVFEVCPVVAEFEPLLAGTLPASIQLVVETTCPLWVRGDPTELKQVLMNLVVNARDAMPDGGRLTLRACLDELGGRPAARIDVSDTGVGMEDEVRERIFEPFFTTKRSEQGGSGLGLATVYGIVRAWGGNVSVETAPGSGSTFTVRLPSVTEPPPSYTAKPRGLVLLGLSDCYTNALVADALKGSGFRVEPIADGALMAGDSGSAPVVSTVVDAAYLARGDGRLPGRLVVLAAESVQVPQDAIALLPPVCLDDIVSVVAGKHLLETRGSVR